MQTIQISTINVKPFAPYIKADELGKSVPHCLASAVVSIDGVAKSTMVIDKYSPRKGNKTGYYFAFRRPGFVKGETPVVRVWMGETAQEVAPLLRDPASAQDVFMHYFMSFFQQFTHAEALGEIAIYS